MFWCNYLQVHHRHCQSRLWILIMTIKLLYSQCSAQLWTYPYIWTISWYLLSKNVWKRKFADGIPIPKQHTPLNTNCFPWSVANQANAFWAFIFLVSKVVYSHLCTAKHHTYNTHPICHGLPIDWLIRITAYYSINIYISGTLVRTTGSLVTLVHGSRMLAWINFLIVILAWFKLWCYHLWSEMSLK